MKKTNTLLALCALALMTGPFASSSRASSHMDAPLITRDPAANTTDVYAFVRGTNETKSLVTALGVYPHEEPGVGPNKYNFDDNVLYQIHVAVEMTWPPDARPSVTSFNSRPRLKLKAPFFNRIWEL